MRVLTRLEEVGASRRVAYLLLAVATAAPRLVALVVDRANILMPYTLGEKSDDIARTFVDNGTFGFIPGLPTAYTQPLYSFFLIPLYALFERSWIVVGSAQILVAIGLAVIVYEIGRRWLSPAVGVLGALLTTLHPYSIWHDVHVNREILDALLAAAIMLLTLALTDRRSLALAVTFGAVLGVAILGNVRLAALPLVLLAFLFVSWRVDRRALALAAAVLATCAAVIVPWVVRNHQAVGCFALTTDSRSLWEANNARTLSVLRAGLWIDDLKLPRSFPPSAQDAGREYRRHGRIIRVDECRQMRFYRGEVLDFWRDQPGEKAKLAAQASLMLWSPQVTPKEVGSGSSSALNRLRGWIEPLYMLPLYALALLAIPRVPRRVASLSIVLLG